MKSESRKTEFLTGLFLVIGLTMLAGLILQFGQIRDWLKDKYRLTVAFKDGTGLANGTFVMIGGAKIGYVSGKPILKTDATGVMVPLEIYEGVQIFQGSDFVVSNSGLMGNPFIEIRPPALPTNVFIEPGSYIEGKNKDGLEALQAGAQEIGDKVSATLDEMKLALKQLNATLQRVDKTVLGEQNTAEINGAIVALRKSADRLETHYLNEENAAQMKKVLTDLNTSTAQINDKYLTDANAAKLSDSLDTIKRASTKLEARMDSLGRAFADLEITTKDSKTTIASIGKMADSFKKVGDDMQGLIADVRTGKGQGLLAALVADPRMKFEFQNLITNLRERGVLFYKDKSGDRQQAELLQQQQQRQQQPEKPLPNPKRRR